MKEQQALDARNVIEHYPGILPYFSDILKRYPPFREFEIYENLQADLDLGK
jgi:hypothetical protein